MTPPGLLARADAWATVGREMDHSAGCYDKHLPCLIGALAARVRVLEARSIALRALARTMYSDKHIDSVIAEGAGHGQAGT